MTTTTTATATEVRDSVEERFQTRVGGDVAIKVRLRSGVDLQRFPKVGEAVARKAVQGPSGPERVWVWVYGHDMEVQGPAVCVAYADGDGATSEFVEPKRVQSWYLMRLLEDKAEA